MYVPRDQNGRTHIQAALLVGFDEEQFEEFQTMLQGMGADMVPIMCADARSLQGSLQEALNEGTRGFVAPPAGARRAVFLSGMYTAEVRTDCRTMATRKDLNSRVPV